MTEDGSGTASEEPRGRTSRRGFLSGAAGLTGVALGVAEWKPGFADEGGELQVDALAATRRGYVAGKYGIELDGVAAGWVQSVEGGNATSDVVVEKLGPTGLSRKHIAGVKYEDITIAAGTGMSKQFYSWISDSVSAKPVRQSGAIVGVDLDSRELNRLTFYNGLISEIGLPALDAASKDAAKLTIKVAPEYTRTTVNFGRPPGPPIKLSAGVQKKWLPANFKFDIGGLDCTRVNKVEAIVIKLEHAGPDQAGQRKIDIPNLKITLPEASAADFFRWHEDFLIKGNNGREQEKRGSLSYLATDLKTELFRLDLFGLGIFALDRDPFITGQEPVRHVTAQFYCDQMVFSFEGGGQPG